MIVNFGVLFVGVCFFLGSVFLFIKNAKNRRNNTASVMAELIGYREEESYSNDTLSVSYFPIMRYYVNGKWYESKSDVGRGRQPYAVGERLEIMYNPEDPNSFHIAGDRLSIIVAALCALIGIGVCALAFFAR